MNKIIKLLIILLIFSNGYGQSFPQKLNEDNQIRSYNGFTLSYNETHEQANWVYYVNLPNNLKGEVVKVSTHFVIDNLIPTKTATHSDYTHSGYDRGHLKPAGDEPSDSTRKRETYYMSNVSPQAPSFNRGVWKRLENYVRTLTLSSDSVIVITGPILNDSLNVIGRDNKISVPEFYFKVIYVYVDGCMVRYCYLLPNKKSDDDLSTFAVTINTIEENSKLLFE